MIEIDGSYGSGGGQILRTACALSTVTKKPCQVFNIRKSRPKPGLMPQHLLGIQALSQLCNGRLEGDSLGSEEIKFYPGETYKDRVSVNIPTAGSITLCLQSLLPVALFAPSPSQVLQNKIWEGKPVKIFFEGGGTDVPFSPTFDYFRYVFLKALEKMGAKVEVNILKRGYYPEGGGRAEVKIYPSKLKNLKLIERGQLKKILAISSTSEFLQKKKVAERQISGIKGILSSLKLPFETRIEYSKTNSPGSSICLIAEFEQVIFGSDGLGKLGKSAEEVGRECALRLLEEEKTKACADRFLTDQILPYLALTNQKCQVKIPQLTLHAKTNVWIIQQFLKGNFEIKDNIIFWIPFE